MKQKVYEIRMKYQGKSIYQLLFSKEVELMDRLFMIFMAIWVAPIHLLFIVLWFILFLPHKAFCFIDDVLN